MCRPERNLHGTKTGETKQAKVRKIKVKTKERKPEVYPSYSGKDEYDWEREAQLFFLQNEDVLY